MRLTATKIILELSVIKTVKKRYATPYNLLSIVKISITNDSLIMVNALINSSTVEPRLSELHGRYTISFDNWGFGINEG